MRYAVAGKLRPPEYVGLRNSAGPNASRSEATRAGNTVPLRTYARREYRRAPEATPAADIVIPKKKRGYDASGSAATWAGNTVPLRNSARPNASRSVTTPAQMRRAP